jgi:hypothetical protein
MPRIRGCGILKGFARLIIHCCGAKSPGASAGGMSALASTVRGEFAVRADVSRVHQAQQRPEQAQGMCGRRVVTLGRALTPAADARLATAAK